MPMRFVDPKKLVSSYNLVVIGSGFGSLFFLKRWLARTRPPASVVILERGPFLDYPDQIASQQNSPLDIHDEISVPQGQKPWNYTLGLGGGTNCWFGQTPRMMPSDFQIHTLYGVGADWPIAYTDLEPWYCEAEQIMGIAGPQVPKRLFPRSKPYPLPPHLPSTPDRAMLAVYPETHMIIPTARASVPTKTRGQCCSVGTCNLCPVNAKFTAFNGLRDVLEDPRVSIVLNADVKQLDVSGGREVTTAVYTRDSQVHRVRGDLFVLGANAIFNAAILYRSGLRHARLGKGIDEQVGFNIEVLLNGMKNFDGSTLTTTLNYSQYDGEHRKRSAAVLYFFENRWKITGMRTDFKRWREVLPITLNAEDLPSVTNQLVIPKDWNDRITVNHAHHSQYANRGIRRAIDALPELLRPLPVEDIRLQGYRATESHLLGTTIMGESPESSICDSRQVHHESRNLIVVGSSVFPSCAPANPSLTVAALSLRAAGLIQ
jgi:choline dehydrogenase-like flavoprotein